MERMGCSYSLDRIILPSMCDGDSNLSIPAAFEMFQDMATLHADFFDIGPDGMNRRNYFWVISKTAMHINRMPKMMGRVVNTTWFQHSDRAKCERDFAIYDGDETLIECRSIWAVMSHDTGRIVPMDELYPNDVTFDHPAPDYIEFSRVSKDFGGCEEIGKYRIRTVDIDLGGHMNNVNYVRAMLGCFSSEELREMNITDIEVQYISQSYEGETLRFLKRDSGDGVMDIGAVRDSDRAVFIARLRCSGQ